MTQVVVERAPFLVEDFGSSRASANLTRLCSEEFQGPRVGTTGHDRAQAWLLEQMKEMGLTSKILTVPEVIVRDLYAAPSLSRLTSDGNLIQSYKHRSEFSEHLRSADQPELIQGLAQRDMNANLEGAWLMLDTVPKGDEFTLLAERLRGRGAIGILVPQRVTSEAYLPKRLMSQTPLTLPVIAVHAERFAELEGSQIRAAVPLRTSVIQAGNVVAILPGIDAALETVPLIVGAHYDGVGDDPKDYEWLSVTADFRATGCVF